MFTIAGWVLDCANQAEFPLPAREASYRHQQHDILYDYIDRPGIDYYQRININAAAEAQRRIRGLTRVLLFLTLLTGEETKLFRPGTVFRALLGTFLWTLVLQTPLFANWVDTTALAVLNGDLYTIEKSGVLKRTNLSTGKVVPVGKADFANTRIMVAGSGSLFTIDPSGNLNRINPGDGTWKQVGKAGDWAKSTAFAMLGDQLYTVESGGELYTTNTATGVWKQVGGPDFVRSKYLLTAGDQLYSIEHDGDLHAIDKATGAWKKIGDSGDWINTRLATSLNGKIYTIESGSPGSLFETDPKTGTWKQIGKKSDFRAKYLFPAGSSLYSIEFDGNMYRIDPVTGAQVGVG